MFFLLLCLSFISTYIVLSFILILSYIFSFFHLSDTYSTSCSLTISIPNYISIMSSFYILKCISLLKCLTHTQHIQLIFAHHSQSFVIPFHCLFTFQTSNLHLYLHFDCYSLSSLVLILFFQSGLLYFEHWISCFMIWLFLSIKNKYKICHANQWYWLFNFCQGQALSISKYLYSFSWKITQIKSFWY